MPTTLVAGYSSSSSSEEEIQPEKKRKVLPAASKLFDSVGSNSKRITAVAVKSEKSKFAKLAFAPPQLKRPNVVTEDSKQWHSDAWNKRQTKK